GPGEVVEASSIPAVLPFEGADAGFAAGSPLDGSAERAAVFVGLAGVAGAARARDHHGPDRELCQVVLSGGFAVAAVGGDGARTPPGAGDDTADGGDEL